MYLPTPSAFLFDVICIIKNIAQCVILNQILKKKAWNEPGQVPSNTNSTDHQVLYLILNEVQWGIPNIVAAKRFTERDFIQKVEKV